MRLPSGSFLQMDKAEEYRQRAASCLRLAMRAKDAAEKAELIEMACLWRILAIRTKSEEPPKSN